MVEQAYWYSHTRWSLYDPFPSFAPRESDHSQIAELAQSRGSTQGFAPVALRTAAWLDTGQASQARRSL